MATAILLIVHLALLLSVRNGKDGPFASPSRWTEREIERVSDGAPSFSSSLRDEGMAPPSSSTEMKRKAWQSACFF